MRTALQLALLCSLAISSRAAAARGDAKALFEEKCFFCHSGTPIQKQRLSTVEWRKVVDRMRKHAPLLISPAQGATIVQYLVTQVRLGPRGAPRPGHHREPGASTPEPAEPEPAVMLPQPSSLPPPPPVVAEEPAAPSDPEAEDKGPGLLQDRCSKCHSTYRVYTKIDKLSTGLAVIERMRHKTGANITPPDADLLARFLRTRIDPDAR